MSPDTRIVPDPADEGYRPSYGMADDRDPETASRDGDTPRGAGLIWLVVVLLVGAAVFLLLSGGPKGGAS